jgi:hypothetical protein
MTFSQKLDAVSKAKQAYVLARTTLEARLREQMRLELANLQTQIDIAVRYAVDAGESKASVLRALGTKDYNTVKASLDRTQAVAEIVGADPLANVYLLDGNDGYEFLHVHYVNHGTQGYTGDAKFRVKRLDNGGILFLAETPLWNDDYTIRNDVVVALDGKTDGEYYEEAVAWTYSQ